MRSKGYDIRIRNEGVSGDTSAAARARLDMAISTQPLAAIVFIGRNDRRLRMPVERTRANVAAIVEDLEKRGIPTLLCGFHGYDLADIAAAHGAAYYPDFFAGVGENGRKFRRYILPLDLFGHLNPSGHKVIAERLLPSVEALVRRARP